MKGRINETWMTETSEAAQHDSEERAMGNPNSAKSKSKQYAPAGMPSTSPGSSE